jgi:hypothetical protein
MDEFPNTSLPKTDIGESQGNFHHREGQREIVLSRIASCYVTLDQHFPHQMITSSLRSGYSDN